MFKFTPSQEQELALAEQKNARARIYEAGVAAVLKDWEYSGDTETCAVVLQEAVDLRKIAREDRIRIENKAESATPRGKKAPVQ